MSVASTEPLVVDAAARELISDTGLGQTLFVEAGAGSGKTTQLVNRIVSLVLTEGVRLADIAAITFTEAAAAELQARIRVRFETEALAAAAADDTERLDRCRLAIADADLAAISTLHGFASRLLGEFAVDAHLPPRISVLDEISSQLAHEERWARFVDGLYADTSHHELLIRAAALGLALEQRYRGQATFRDVADVLTQNWDRIEPIVTLDPPPLGPVDLSSLDEAIAEVRALPELCTDPSDNFFVHLATKVLPQLDDVDAAGPDPIRRLQAAGAVKWGPGNGGRGAAWRGDIKQHKEAVKHLNEVVSDILLSAVDPVLQHLLVLTASEVATAADARRDNGGLEFHDLLVLARDLLRRSPSARAILHARYRHLLLDEFQDTDPLQIDLATLIAASIGGADSTPASWVDLAVDPGRLFFVGDPKQSIYRFRRADIQLFLEARDRFGGAEPVRLITNFRTVEPVLTWVNELFADAMPVEVPGAQPAYQPLVARRAPSPTGDHRPVLLGGPHHDPKAKAGALREAEAADVAAALSDIRERPADWPVLDEHTGAWRPARLSDVTVLVPTRTSLPYLRRALAAIDMPYRLATGTLVYDTQEVRDALAALRAIDDPTDELSLVAALRSPLYACSDADLFTFRQRNGRWNLRAPRPPAVPADHPVALAIEHLRGLWQQRWWSGPADLLDQVLRDRQADLLAFGDPRPKEVWRRLRFLLDQARAFEESGGGGLRAFLDWAAMQGADGARVHEPLLAETDDEAVAIMTVHGAKGLEFPITVLSGMTTRPGGRRPGVSVVWGDGAVPALRLSANVATADHEPRADLEEAMDVHEKLRLLYVAATRARDHLVVSCHHRLGDGPTDTYASRVWSYFEDRDHLWRRLDVKQGQLDLGLASAVPEAPVVATEGATWADDDPGPALPDLADDRDEWLARRAALLDPQRVPRVVSATAIAIGSRQAATDATDAPGGDGEAHDDFVDDLDRGPEIEQTDDDPPRRRGRAGSAVGRAVHATLEVLDLAIPTDIEAQVARQCELEAIGDLADTVEALVRSALTSDTVTEAASLPHHKELLVAAPVGSRVIEGYIDLLVETPEGLVVVDYKTDSARSEAEVDAALERYELQGASYAVALEEATGTPVVDCRFVFCRKGGAIERSVRNLPAAMAEVRARLT